MRRGKASPVERTVLLTDQTEHQSPQGREQGGVLSTECVKLTLVHGEATDFIEIEATSPPGDSDQPSFPSSEHRYRPSAVWAHSDRQVEINN